MISDGTKIMTHKYGEFKKIGYGISRIPLVGYQDHLDNDLNIKLN